LADRDPTGLTQGEEPRRTVFTHPGEHDSDSRGAGVLSNRLEQLITIARDD
jgi:hypothetical protein